MLHWYARNIVRVECAVFAPCIVLIVCFCWIPSTQDEENQAAIGRILPAILKHSQVICVSHHARFQRQAPHRISVLMENGSSTVESEHGNSLQQR